MDRDNSGGHRVQRAGRIQLPSLSNMIPCQGHFTHKRGTGVQMTMYRVLSVKESVIQMPSLMSVGCF